MTDFFVQFALSNLLVSTLLAAVAYTVHRRGRYPMLAHLLWVLVLVKMVTPPLLHLPIVPGTATGTAAAFRSPSSASVLEQLGGAATGGSATAGSGLDSVMAALSEHGLTMLLVIWAIGSLLILTASLTRIVRFDRLLRRSSAMADEETQAIASGAAWQLGLTTVPPVFTSRARLSPMTWWTGGSVRVVIPAVLPYQLDAAQLRWVLAHELAHVKRRDHLVRWLEWLACVAFWWNPIVWFARRNLRLDEEVSCDALVLDRLHGQPRSYAQALLTVVEFLAGQTDRPPAFASGIDASGSLERRFKAIVSQGGPSKAPRSLVIGLLSTAVVLMSGGVGFAGDAPSKTNVRGDSAAAAAAADGTDISLSATQGEVSINEPGAVRFALLGANVNIAAALGKSSSGSVVSASRPAWASVFVGTPRADVYAGSGGRDRIVGMNGADDLSGAGSRDLILAGRGADAIAGGRGADKLIGGPGDDTIEGNQGPDVIRAGKGSDTVKAGSGNDVVETWQDGTADTVDCGAGDHDRAIIDSTDTSVNCEVVVVREAV